MELYEIQTDHIIVNTQEQEISLNDGIVIGISVEVLADSGEPDLFMGLNEAPKVKITNGSVSRAYGGFSVGNNPGVYRGNLKLKFNSNTTPKALVILTRLVPEPLCL